MARRVDMHVHFVGRGSDIEKADTQVYFNADDNQHLLTRVLYKLLDENLQRMGGDADGDGAISTGEYLELLRRLLASSEEIDEVVLLALDAVYSPATGERDDKKTDFWVTNRLLGETISHLNALLRSDSSGSGKRFLMGSSISPNRRDWEKELEYVLEETDAVLVKLIPSVQHISMDESVHKEFFDALARKKIPLLCHVGPEYTFPEGMRRRELDCYKKLGLALERGVTLIAAHCATPVFPLLDRDDTREFSAFMRDANSGGEVRLWSDTSALSMTTRISLAPKILELFPPEQLLHGSDFPIPIEGWAHLPYVTRGVDSGGYTRIVKTKNPLDRDVRIKRAMGFSDEILLNAEKVLRL
jgi:hypothetical protein